MDNLLAQSPDGDALSVIENPAAVSHTFHSEKTPGVAATEEVQGWIKGIQSTTHAILLHKCQTQYTLLKRTAMNVKNKLQCDSALNQSMLHSQTGEAAGSGVRSWTPRRLSSRRLVSSQTSAEAILPTKSSGTRGHKGDAFLQCDRGYLHL
ncbi:hypothetical protein E3U43_011553 [Larimichthys crocea]|uniref:Uncharacterized protein n=1 Tax=Larimichthys crocea TaxID=215358 RepID=A0ACD3QK31_LARCR|nr:hypothetical protein E3U43_011553 [Larimichthys crocea]